MAIHALPRLWVVALVFSSSILVARERPAVQQLPGVHHGFVVHEWGVMIREGGDLLAPPVELFDSVPKFVLQHHQHFKPALSITHMPQGGLRVWDKPVLHFYGKPGTKVTVRVMTPKGRPLMYWPQPKLLSKTVPMDANKALPAAAFAVPAGMKYGITQATGMEWTGEQEAARNLLFGAGDGRLVAIFLDWCSLPQHPRTPAEELLFQECLGDINSW